ncbi:PREDICTED: uncharacterized protein LOC109329403, partial [Lupinus angustifolius]|uniref:uncharacterized protein LOC109329403 n=1 Tax=Lupinus angustifolius TaxID=3871 RepID=UPI00092F73F1
IYVLVGWEGSTDSRVLRDALSRSNGLRVPQETQGRIMIACCFLHNRIRKQMNMDPLEINFKEGNCLLISVKGHRAWDSDIDNRGI